MAASNAFWADLHERLEDDPEFASQYLLEAVKISTVDRLVNTLESERTKEQISKAALARMIQRDPAAIRRFLSEASGNPTIETVSSVAAAMGLRLELVPMEDSERETVSDPLRALANS